MEQECKTVAIVGAGASGCICAYHLLKSGIPVTLFDKASPLRTLLPTGGGRCNLAHAEFVPKSLAENYPRGEKFLYSVFSRFSTSDTLDMFSEMGIETYIQDNGRIFPISNSAKDVRSIILDNLRKLGAKFVTREVTNLWQLMKKYSDVVVSVGGHSGYDMLEYFDINIISPKPSLVGLNTKENLKSLAGIVCKNACIEGLQGDILFTHFGISGPLVYTISSYKAFDEMPYDLYIDLLPNLDDFQNILNTNPQKEIKNVLSMYFPQRVAEYILQNLDATTKACNIDGKTRDLILNKIHNFKVSITGSNNGEETVTAGGVDLKEINPKTMELKKVPHLYCIGEVLNIDGLCGGFNLQNAWSNAYVCAQGILSNH